MHRIGLIITFLFLLFYSTARIAEAGPSHPWHDLDAGPESPVIVNVVVEIPRDSKNKYEIDKKTGILTLDRVLSSSVHYPTNYGFIPRSYQEDGDPLDVLVLTQEPIYPLTVVKVRVIGVMLMKDDGKSDTKILAVPVNDMQYARYTDIAQLPEHILKEIRLFFEEYKALDGVKVTVERYGGAPEAVEEVRKALKLYDHNRQKLQQI